MKKKITHFGENRDNNESNDLYRVLYEMRMKAKLYGCDNNTMRLKNIFDSNVKKRKTSSQRKEIRKRVARMHQRYKNR